MKYVLIIIAAMTSACAKNHSLYIDPAFYAQWSAFQAAAITVGSDASYVDNLRVEFGDTKGACGPDAVGCCQKKKDLPPTVLVDQTYWTASNPTDRELLIFHELGHCLLNRSHNNTLYKYAPESIMYYSADTYMTTLYQNAVYHKAYINELFGVGTGPDFTNDF